MSSKKFSGKITSLRAGIIFLSFLVGTIVLSRFSSLSDLVANGREIENNKDIEKSLSSTRGGESRNVIFIYGLGGSGTRGVTKLLESWGCDIKFYKLNPALDNKLVFRLNPFADDILKETNGTADYDAASLSDDLLQQIDEKMKDIVKVVNHVAERSCVVVKWPRLIYLAPVLKLHFPEAKFVLVVRDGRDMAVSRNRIQFNEFNKFYLTPGEKELPKIDRIMLFWYRVNFQAKTWQVTKAPSDSIVLRIESLVLDADEAVYNQLYSTTLSLPPPLNLSRNDIFEVPIANRMYNMTTKYGKYKYVTNDRDKQMFAELENRHKHELEEFGYSVSSTKV